MTTTIQRTLDLTVTVCPTCGITYALPTEYDRQLRRAGKGLHVYCPNGHPWSYIRSVEAELSAARDEARFFKGQRDQERREHEHTRRRLSATKGVVTRIQGRVQAGVCPVTNCHAHFANLERHIRRQHPDFQFEQVEEAGEA